MLTLFGNLDSGNVHKVQMILNMRGLPFRRVDVRQDRGEPADPRFRALNPIGKVPALLLEDGTIMSESGALLFYLAEGTGLWPDDRRRQAEVLRWMFFEQYSHEPALAVLRYLMRFSGDIAGEGARIRDLTQRSGAVLDVMAACLSGGTWLTGTEPSIADLALYPYTRFADELGFDIAATRPAVADWLTRVEALPNFLPVYADAAQNVVPFGEYFGPEAVSRPAQG